jgi:hypothetical protein
MELINFWVEKTEHYRIKTGQGSFRRDKCGGEKDWEILRYGAWCHAFAGKDLELLLQQELNKQRENGIDKD